MSSKRIGTTAQGFERFDDGASVQNVETTYVDTEGDGTYAKTGASRLYVWSAGLLDWIRWDGSVTGGGGGGGGGAVTVADGADVAQGATTDASSANTVVGLLKAIKAFLAGTLTVGGSVSVSNFPASQNVADGGGSLTVDAPVGTPMWVRLSDGAAAYVGQKVAASSIPVVIASDQSSLPTTEARLPTALVGGRLDVNIGAAGATVGVNPSGETAGVGIGAAADAEAAGNGSAIAVLKRIRTLLGGTLIVSLLNGTLRGASTGAPAATDTALVVGIRDDVDVRDRAARLLGHVTVDNASLAVTGSGIFHVDDNAGSLTIDSADLGAQADAEAAGNGSLIAIVKRLRTLLNGGLPAALAASGALKVDQQSALPTGANTIGKVDQGAAGASRWLVDASGVAVPVTDNAGSLTVDAPVGTPVFVRLSDGAAVLVGQKAAAAGIPVTLASDQTVVDNAGFTDGTTPLIMTGYVFDETAGTALTENDAAAARVDSKRATVGVIEDATTRGTRATVKAASTAPAATDTALVVVPRTTPSEGTAFASASRAAGTYTFDIADTTGFSGIAIITDLTVLGASSTVTNSIQVKDPVTAKFATATAAAFTAVNAVSTTRQAMNPANAGATGNLQGGVMTKTIRVNVVVATAASTFSVGYSLTP